MYYFLGMLYCSHLSHSSRSWIGMCVFLAVMQHENFNTPQKLRRLGRFLRANLLHKEMSWLNVEGWPSSAGQRHMPRIRFDPFKVLPEEILEGMTGAQQGNTAVAAFLLRCPSMKAAKVEGESEPKLMACGRVSADVTGRYDLKVNGEDSAHFFCAQCCRKLRKTGKPTTGGARMVLVWWEGGDGPIQLVMDAPSEPIAPSSAGADEVDGVRPFKVSMGEATSHFRFRVKGETGARVWRGFREARAAQYGV